MSSSALRFASSMRQARRGSRRASSRSWLKGFVFGMRVLSTAAADRRTLWRPGDRDWKGPLAQEHATEVGDDGEVVFGECVGVWR